MARRWSRRPPWPPSTTIRSGEWPARRAAPARGRWRPSPRGGDPRGRRRPRRPATRPRSPSRSRPPRCPRSAPAHAPGRPRSPPPPRARRRGRTGSWRAASGSPPVTTTIVSTLRGAIGADSLRRHYPVQVPRVGGALSVGHPLSPAAPSSPSCWHHRTGTGASGTTVIAVQRTLFDDDHELFRESVRGFIAAELAPHNDEWERSRDRRPRAVHARPGRSASSAWPPPRSTAAAASTTSATTS